MSSLTDKDKGIVPPRGIRICSGETFLEMHWARAISTHLNVALSNRGAFVTNPVINFDGVYLHMDPIRERYVVYGIANVHPPQIRQEREGGRHIVVSNNPPEVEWALQRLIYDPDVCSVKIWLKERDRYGAEAWLKFSRMAERTQLGVSGVNIPVNRALATKLQLF